MRDSYAKYRRIYPALRSIEVSALIPLRQPGAPYLARFSRMWINVPSLDSRFIRCT